MPEFLESQLINVTAPFLIIKELEHLLKRRKVPSVCTAARVVVLCSD
jgi:hypothetical protein